MTTSKPLAFIPSSIAKDHGLTAEDLGRADIYGLLAELLMRAPSDNFFNRLATSPATKEDQSELNIQWQALIQAAKDRNPNEIADEYDDLFVAVGKPAVPLHASVYLFGSMNQKPLVLIREDLAQLGIERDPDAPETEDHIAAMCEIMRFLIAGQADENEPPQDTLISQDIFFGNHLRPWAKELCDAMESHPIAYFYARVASFARVFFAIEQQSFDIFRASSEAIQGQS